MVADVDTTLPKRYVSSEIIMAKMSPSLGVLREGNRTRMFVSASGIMLLNPLDSQPLLAQQSLVYLSGTTEG
jgi:hypothetical protein